MNITQPTYSPGATAIATSYNFLSEWDAIAREVDPRLYMRYGTGRLTGLAEYFNFKKPVSALKYDHFEMDRVMPKVKATCSAGAAGAAVTFTNDSTSNVAVDQNNSPYAGSANTVNSYPVRKGDLLMIKPTSGTVAYTSIIFAWVSATSGSTFTAYPLDSTDSIPAISSADEIVIYGNAHGEGSAAAEAMAVKATLYTNQLHIFKDKVKITDIGTGMKTWVDYNGQPFWRIPNEKEAVNRLLNNREMTLLFNPGLSNTSISNLQGAAATPMTMTKGFIQEIIDKGTTATYSGITGFTKADFEDLSVTLDKQKAQKNLMFCMGTELKIQIDNEMADATKNGAISYGAFSGDAAKNINFEFNSITVGGHSYMLKVVDAMNDLQTLGASGFNFPKEGWIMSADRTSDPSTGENVPPFRMRYLQAADGSKEMTTKYYDGETSSATGDAVEEVRYKSIVGMEAMALNQCAYVKLQ